MDFSKTVAVLDVELSGQRRLTETLSAVDLPSVTVESLEELGECFRSGKASVGLVAFEALWPEPQTKLRTLRDAAPSCRVLVAHSNVPRRRLGQRLWSVGLIDYFFSRSAPPHELGAILRQAIADAMVEDLEGQRLDAESTGSVLVGVRLLTELAVSFANQSTVEGLLRALHIKLPRFIPYSTLQVLTVEDTAAGGRCYQFHTQQVDHDASWKVTEAMCRATSPFFEDPITPEDLVYVDSPPTVAEFEAGAASGDAPSEPYALALVHCGELVGCIGLQAYGEVTNAHRMFLRIVGNQLATSIRSSRALKMAERASLVDELTGAHNRRYMNRLLPTEWRRARRYGQHLTLAMIDIDYFKRLNDDWGHLVGDAALRTVVGVMRENLRDTDHIIRYGGEEFLLILSETGTSEAALVVERLRILMRKHPIPTGGLSKGPLLVTFSAGIASIPGNEAETWEQLVELADNALMIAKRTGRDRVCVASANDDNKPVEANAGDKRRFPRIPTELEVQYLPLPDLGVRTITMKAFDYSAGGVGVVTGGAGLKRSSYALVYLEHGAGPLLSQVAWTSDADGETAAGLKFLHGEEFDSIIGAAAVARPKALVFVSTPATRSLVRRVLQAAQYDGVYIESIEEVADLAISDFNVVLVGETPARAEIVTLINEAPTDSGLPPRIVLVNEQGSRSDVFATVREQRVEHVVGDIDSEQALFTTLSKLVVGDYFGLTKYLMWGAEPKSWTLSDPEEKRTVLEGIRSLAQDVSCHPRVCDLLIAAVDEMIVNAVYRSDDNTPSEVVVEAASDSRLFGVAVLDTHGRLSPSHVYTSLGKAMSYQRDGLPKSPERMSLGFWIMLNTLNHVAINVDPGRRTEIIGIIDLKKSLREVREAVPSLGLFTKK